ncbi:MAG: hypothetical protein GX417_07620 [Clostridiales bacterium]|nr:hypothetical protein [Clostridiales bacterium]
MLNKQRIWGFFAHASIIVGMMFVVFFVIDRFNPAMEFLTSSLSKWLILFLAVCAMANGLFSAVLLFQRLRRHEEKQTASHAAAPGRPERALPPQDLRQYGYAGGYSPRQRPQPDYAGGRAYPAQRAGTDASPLPPAGGGRRA